MDEESDFLDGMMGEERPVEVAAEPEPAKEPAKPRDEHGRFAPKETGVEQQPETEAEQVSPTPGLPKEEYEAVKGERQRRQAAEARLAALEEQLQALQQPQEAPKPPPSIWDDEEGALQHNRQQTVSEAAFNARLDASEMLASQAHDDFDEMKAKFIELMTVNPALQKQALAARHPWAEAYKIAKNAAKAEALGAVDVADMEAKLRAQIEAEMAAQKPTPPALPRSLADAQSGNGSTGAVAAPLTLADIFGN